MTTSFRNPPIAVDSVMPAQSEQTDGKTLISNGVTVSWNTILGLIGTNTGQTPQAATANAVLPPQTSSAGMFLMTTGANAVWSTIPQSTVGTLTSGGIGAYEMLSITSPLTPPGDGENASGLTSKPGVWVQRGSSSTQQTTPVTIQLLIQRTA